MAVENKFKLNVIAASVLMGLSLSSVAAEVSTGATTPVADSSASAGASATRPAPATLADKAGVANISKINVTVDSASKPLSEVLQGVDGSTLASGVTDTSKKKTYDDAVLKMGEAQKKVDALSQSDKDKIKTYETSGMSLKNAQSGMNDFITKATGVDKVYREKLNALYGTTDGEFNIDESKQTIAPNVVSGSAFAAYSDSAIKGLGTTLTALGVEAYKDAGGESVAAAKTAHDAITTLIGFIYDSEKVALEKQEIAASENYIAEKLPAFLQVIERHKDEKANLGDKKTPKLREHYDAYISAVDAFRKATGDDVATKKTAVYTALQALVGDVNGSGSAVASLSSGDKTVTSKFKTSLEAVSKIISTTNASLVIDMESVADVNVGGKKITTEQEALTQLKTSFDALLAAANTKLKDDKNTAGQKKLQDAVDKATNSYRTFTAARDKYNTLHQEVTDAGNARLSLSTEWQNVDKSYADAWKAYNEAKNEYDSLTDVSSLATAEADVASKRGEYIKSLSEASAATDGAITAAGKAYADAIKATGVTQAQKNAALYTLIGQKKALVPVKLRLDKEALELAELGYTGSDKSVQSLKALQDSLAAAEAGKADAEQKYNAAVTEYLAAQKKLGADKTVANEVAASVAGEQLKHAAGVSDVSSLYNTSGDASGGFVTFDKLPESSTVKKAFTAAQDAVYNATTKTDIQNKRQAVAKGLNDIVSLMPLSTADEQKTFRTAYLDALKAVSSATTTADAQGKRANAENITHYLGGLTPEQIATFNTASGQFNSVIVNVDEKGNITGVKDNFTGKDLYTGTKDKPFTTTVLDISAPELGNGALADTNTITVGEAGSKATPVEVWAKTAGTAATPAVKLSGNLRTATAQLDENGQPMDGQIVRGADQIHLQNVNIHNSFTLADKVQMLKDDMAALNRQAADKLALGQPADGDKGVEAWRKTQTGLLNSKYDKLKLTGLQIDTRTVNPEFDLNTGEFVNNVATVAPKAANILLDNLNITLQNDSVNGTSTAIDLSGKSNHILVNGGVFDAGSVTGTGAQANALYITDTGTNNLIDFNGSVLKGDIRSDAAGNTVNLTNGSLTGNAIAGTGNLSLNLDNSVWTGGAGPNSPDVSLSNNSVWNVKNYGGTHTGGVSGPYASVNSLSLYGSNRINLAGAGGLAQLGGHGFAGTKSAVTLNVDTDLTSDGKGVTTVLAGTYSPGNLHSLTNTGLSGGYQSGTLHVNGLALGGKYRLNVESSGAEPYTIGGRLADGPGVTSAHEFVSYKTSESRVVTDKDGKPVTQIVKSDADFTSLSAPAEMGVYQYAAEKVMDGVNNRTNIYYSSTGRLSNSAATAVSMAAAPVDVANLQSDTLAKHMNSVRHGKDSGVWLSYFGGENRNTTAVGPEYKLKTNGVMLGVDTLTENNWLAGVAVSSARSDMSVMNSSGDLDSYGAQFYMSRRYDSGVFVDGALQFNHFSNTAKARMINGQQAKADFSGNSYGLEAKVGYAWNSEGFFAEPYVRAAARAFDGEHYALSNGMTVNSNDYKSMLGEVGADLGYQYAISGGYVKPYLHLAALNEFADGNSVRVNNVSLDDSVKGAAFQAGLGAEVKMTDNLGGYAAFDYTKGDNTERPWQATVGVNYTW
ncbi:autotransporter outer membrane beta-barrel domain-containing protein [Salmonella enterica]|nr:autotransporter outer membrane beta-barrel domain-containing protein [Salmonella enterica]ECB2071748.1 autotransporter outer membrane beta-barrel domain-containing protein [Salmonella enterica subsp. enterica serovar Benin]EBE6987744.1 autotransporter outer membrane beta-barrel domain-containing protein [Salmonella enterica]EBE7298401.1 autotransporter outer membrane beta-barrel domain-containing protein [Salmonella enterica]EEO5752049.1 autotransporter outer membrane beta-barrel domain-cont